MSQKITSKNLTYDSSLPPFLARLRGQQAAHSGPDPILAAQRRPGQKRSASEEAEDSPVVVDEHGNVVSLKDGLLEAEDGIAQHDKTEVREENGEGRADPDHSVEGDAAQSKEKEKVAGIGASRKRKVGRVIGGGQSDDGGRRTKAQKNNDDSDARIAKASADMRRLLHGDVSTDAHKPPKAADDKSGPQKSVKAAKKKAAKKIKLSFGDNDDGE
ncbi:hypothetical protein GQX73_g4684 [Xylaria multiplex]|uniref:DUF4604 domain-containing protein n=1 Tax=Xylaria multiplex TaxID=323545 RepID=A0A7C8IVC7_9PEZI|nr:hypothetical protein GQX73_g4684 [Xylaria multiplex]